MKLESLIFNFLFPRSPFSNVGLFREVSNGSGQLECHSWPIVSTPAPKAESSFHTRLFTNGLLLVLYFLLFSTVFFPSNVCQITCIVSTARRLNHLFTLDSSPLLLLLHHHPYPPPPLTTNPPSQLQPPFHSGTKLRIIDGDIWNLSCQGALHWRKSLFAHHCLTFTGIYF